MDHTITLDGKMTYMLSQEEYDEILKRLAPDRSKALPHRNFYFQIGDLDQMTGLPANNTKKWTINLKYMILIY